MTTRWVVVMVKEPRPGKVKTRLGRDIGHVDAAWWFRRQTACLLREIRDRRWRLVLAVSPDREGLASRVWPDDLSRIPQGTGNIGERMRRVFRALPPGPVVIVGADIPGITRACVAEAFRALGRAPAVIGPAEDGGYWLVGLRRTCGVSPRLFEGVRWSGEHARQDTIETLPAPVIEVETLRDVDTAEDLAYLKRLRIS